MGSDVIKATATFQEANEPPRQRPIIQISPSNGQQQILSSNLVRASIDSGRDNPFRPDGEIYKSADPIVDYYRHGPNQSRGQSPTDSQLLLNQNSKASKKNSKKAKKADKKADRAKKNTEASQGAGREACWRRWLCCLCCCRSFKCCNKTKQDEQLEKQNQRADVSQYSSVPAVDSKTKEFKQTKIVFLKDSVSSDLNIPRNQESVNTNDGLATTQQVPSLPAKEKSRLTRLAKDLSDEQSAKSGKASNKIDETTKPKSTGKSKCVIS